MQKGKRTMIGVTKKKNICMRMKVRKTKKAKTRFCNEYNNEGYIGRSIRTKKRKGI